MESKKGLIRTIFLYTVAAIAIYWLFHETGTIFGILGYIYRICSPFIAGSVIAFILNVPMRALEKLLGDIQSAAFRRALALLLTIVLISVVIAAVIILLVPQIKETSMTLANELPAFGERAVKWVVDFSDSHPQIVRWLVRNTSVETLDMATVIQEAATIIGDTTTKILNSTVNAVGSITSGIINAVIAVFFAIYALIRKDMLVHQCKKLLYSFLPERVCDQIVRIMRLTNSTFSNFISGQCLEALNLGLMFALVMLIFRMPYVPLVSVLVAVTALVPIVGAFVGCVMGAIFILVDNPMQALWFVVLFLVLQQIEDNLIYPRVVGNSIGLPTMWVLVAVTVGGSTMGVFGMLFMIPFFSVIYTLLREITGKRLEKKGIDPEKLECMPMDHRSHRRLQWEARLRKWKEKRQGNKKK